jgi:PEP-CTERM motif
LQHPFVNVNRGFLTLGVVLIAIAACASTIPTVTMSLVSFDGPFVNYIPTYPYTIIFTPGFPLQGMCNDYYHDGAPGDRWPAFLTNLDTPVLSLMRFGNLGIIPYEEAAWILIQTYAQPKSQWPDMNYAVWRIFNSTVPVYGNSQYWIDQAAANYGNQDYGEVWVATPTAIHAPSTGDQEFLFVWTYRTPPPIPSVPEPGSLALFATSALSAGAAIRRRWKH